MFRVFLKILRSLLLAIILSLLLFCGLFAYLQSKWGKQQLSDKLSSYLKTAGISARLVGLDGQLPFTWTIKQADLEIDNNRHLKLERVKFRIAILPLLKGRISINYLKVERAYYSSTANEGTISWENPEAVKAQLLDQIEGITLPCDLGINYFAIERIETNTPFPVFGITGNARILQNKQEFALAFNFFSPNQNLTFLETTLNGSKLKNLVDAKLKVHQVELSSFFMDLAAGTLSADLSLDGPWSSFEEILYNLPRTKDPIQGELKAMISHAQIPSLPLLNRDWKLKTQFFIPSGEQIYLKKLLVMSDLIHIKGKGEINADLTRSKMMCALSAPNLSLLPFPISGSAKGKAYYQEGSFKASLETNQLVVDHFEANTTRAVLKGSVMATEWEAEVSLSSTDAKIPFESTFALEYEPQNHLSIIDFALTASDATMRGFLYYAIPEKLLDGSLVMRVGHLDQFGFLIKDETLSGAFITELKLSTFDGRQNLFGALVAKNLRYQNYLIDDLSLGATIENMFESPTGKLNVLAEKVYTPSFYLDELTFGTQSDEVHWPFFLNAQGRVESPFAMNMEGFWQNENDLFSLELTQFNGSLSEIPFALHYPSQMEWGSDYLSLSPLHFGIGNGHFYSTFLFSPVRSTAEWDLKQFPLEILSCLKPRFALSGLVSTSGFMDASPDWLEGTLTAALEQAGVLHYGKKEPVRAKGSVQLHFNQDRCQVHSNLNASDAQFLDFTATLPIAHTTYPFQIALDKTKNASAELLAEGKLQDLFDFVNMGTNHFTGLFSCRLFLSQTLRSPSLQGLLDWQNGTYENYFTGITLQDIDAQFEARGDEIHLLSLHANDDDAGEVTAVGKIDLKPEKHFPYSFEAEMKKLHALGFDMIDCDLTGPVYLTGDMYNMFAQGNLVVDEATIQLTERLPYEIPSLPVTYINRPAHLISNTTQMGHGFDFHMDLELTSEGNVKVSGRGLNAELEGNVHLYGTNTSIATSGALQLIKGEYIFSGKVFKLTEGEIVFKDKPTASAYLNLNGTLTLPDITITAMLRGPLTSPQLTFQSNPHKPTSSLLALILFNKDITEISHPEAIQLASTLVSISGGAGPDVLESIRKSIGIDRLSIASKPGTDELAVQIGKYLTRGILITLSQSATSSQVIVEVELPKGFVFQAETQEEEEGKFSLKWRRSY